MGVRRVLLEHRGEVAVRDCRVTRCFGGKAAYEPRLHVGWCTIDHRRHDFDHLRREVLVHHQAGENVHRFAVHAGVSQQSTQRHDRLAVVGRPLHRLAQGGERLVSFSARREDATTLV